MSLSLYLQKFLRWSDQSAIDYWNYGDNEPNNNYGSEKCVSMYSHDGEVLRKNEVKVHKETG